MATMEQRIKDLILTLGTDFKATRAVIGTLTSLSTTEKGSIVGAINEVRAVAVAASGSGGAAIDDVTPTTSTTFSSSKINQLIAASAIVIDDTTAALTKVYSSTKVNAQIAALIDDASTLTTKTFSASKINTLVATKPSINDTTASGTSVYSSTKVNAAVLALIADGVTASGTTWSSTKIQSTVTAAVTALVNGAPGTLDTLKELSDALGGDPNAITSITTALGNRVRFDAAQTLTTAQQLQARSNINAYGAVEIGNPDADFVAAYTAAKV